MDTVRLLQCQQCGASLNFVPGIAVARCVYCHSAYLIDREVIGLESRGGFVTFRVDSHAARAKIEEWLGHGLFSPSDLKLESRILDCDRVYLPYHRVRVRAHSNWSAEVVRYEEDRSRPGKKPRRRRSSWQIVTGAHEADYDDVLIPASPRLAQLGVEAIGTYELDSPETVVDKASEVPFEQPSIPGTAINKSLERIVRLKETVACTMMVPGGVPKDIRVDTRIEVLDRAIVYLPLYVGRFAYEGHHFPVLVNGQSGLVQGRRPRSWPKVAGTVGSLCALGAAVLYWLVRRGR